MLPPDEEFKIEQDLKGIYTISNAEGRTVAACCDNIISLADIEDVYDLMNTIDDTFDEDDLRLIRFIPRDFEHLCEIAKLIVENSKIINAMFDMGKMLLTMTNRLIAKAKIVSE